MRYTSFPGGGLGVALAFVAYLAGGLVIALFVLPQFYKAGATSSTYIFLAVIWSVGLCINGYLYLWKVSYVLESDGRTLEWRAVFRRGEVAVTDLSDVTTSGGQQATLRPKSGAPIYVRRRIGLTQFLQEGLFTPRGEALPPTLKDPNRLAVGFGSGFSRLD